MDKRFNTSKLALASRGPNRTAAHRRPGSAIPSNNGIASPAGGRHAKAITGRRLNVPARHAASMRRRGDEVDIAESASASQGTMTGTNVRTASTFEKKRTLH